MTKEGRSVVRFQTHKRLKERFLIGRNRAKRASYRGSPLFQATYNLHTEKHKTINSTYRVSIRCGKLAEGLFSFFLKRYIVERINKAELRPEEYSEKAESCWENLWNEIQFKGP